MFSYINGIISEINTNSITVDINGVGYLIYTPNPYSFNEGEKYKVYVYHHIREEEFCLFGFKTQEEKELFLKLISVKGLGPKMALPIIGVGSISGIIDAINRENILYLKKFPKIGDKVAKQIILDLKGKLNSNTNVIENNNDEELIEVLKGLGYKDKEIKGVIPKINKELNIEMQIKEALRLFVK